MINTNTINLNNQEIVICQESISDKTTNIARSYWIVFKYEAKRYGRNLRVPKVITSKNSISYVWEQDNLKLMVEITEKDSYYYFSSTRKSHLIWEKHYEPLIPPYGIPTDIYNKVLLFSEEL